MAGFRWTTGFDFRSVTWGGQSGPGTAFSPSISDFPCQYPSIQHSPVSIFPPSIPLSVFFHSAIPCQCPSTHHSYGSILLPSIPLSVSFHSAFPCEYPCTQHSPVSILLPSIPLSVSFYTAFACQYPSYHKDKWVQHWDLQKAIPFQKHRMAGQKTSSTSVASFLHTNCSTSFLFITEAAHLPPLHPLHFPTLYPISNLLLP